MKWFLVDYEYNGGIYTVDLEAEDWEDAESRFYAILVSGHIIGELVYRGEEGDESLQKP